MKHHSFPITSLLLFSLLLLACGKDDDAVEEPNCPTCWDEKMLCVAGNCECPEGAIELWQPDLVVPTEETFPESERKFCVMPDKLTFIARFPSFECFDDFAVAFPFELTEEIPHLPAGTPSVEYQIPESALGFKMRPSLFVWEEDARVYVTFTDVPVSSGNTFLSFNSIFFQGCVEYDDEEAEEPNIIGAVGADFQGYFVHKDTLAGDLVFSGSGTMEHLAGHRLPIQLVRTVPY